LVNNKIYGILGLASRARKVISGTDVVIEAIKKNSVGIVIIAEDASDKTKKNIKYYCEKYHIEYIVLGTIEENSRIIGKNNRAIIGVSDVNFANGIKKEVHGGAYFGKN